MESESQSTNIVERYTAKEEIVYLNVGGQLFATTTTTLTISDPNSMFNAMFGKNGSRFKHNFDKKGNYFIDRDPRYFAVILNYLRTHQVILDPNIAIEGVLEDAKYFNIQGIVDELTRMIDNDTKGPELTRKEVIRILCSSTTDDRLRFFGINLSGLDLSRLDFSGIALSNCNLSYANLTECYFTEARVAKVNFTHANLRNATFHSANLSGANLSNADLTDARFNDAELLV